MKKSLTASDIHHGYLKSKASSRGWALCIGAGTSLPVFPSWRKLVENLIKRDTKLKSNESHCEILSSFNLDALIQAASQILGVDEITFLHLLSDELYSIVRQNTSASEWKSVCRIFTTINANHTNDE